MIDIKKGKKMKHKVAITGVGGGVGQSIIKALQNSEYSLVKIDADPTAAGLYTKGNSYLGEYVKEEKKYIERIIEVCKKEKCKILFPGLDAELFVLSKNKDIIKAETGTEVVVSNPDVINISDDKLLTSKFLQTNNFPYPLILNASEYKNFNYPVIVKIQKGGARSQGCFKINNIKEFDNLLNKIKLDDFIIQEYIEGDEYTCGTVYIDKFYGAIPIKRILRDGDTHKAFVKKNKDMQDFLQNVISTLKPFGACNVQLRVDKNEFKIFEINARCSGTTGIRSLAGFNEPLSICNYLIHGVSPQLDFKEISVLRYWKELVVEADLINEMKKNKEINGGKTSL